MLARLLLAIFKVNKASPHLLNSSLSPVAGRPAWVDLHLANRLKIPHTFVVHTYTKPTKCHYCNKILVGVFKQGLQCKDCRYNVHKKCCEFTPRDCTGDIRLELELPSATELVDREGGEEGDIVTPENFGSHLLVESTQSNIPVQRLVQSVRQVGPGQWSQTL